MDTNLISAGVSDDAFFGEVVYPPGGRLGSRVQRDIQLVMLHEGSCRVRVDGVRHDVAADQLIVLLPGGRESFRFDAKKPSRHSWIAFEYAQRPKRLCAWLGEAMPKVQPIPPRLMSAWRAGRAWRHETGPTAAQARAHLAAAGLLSLIDAMGLRWQQANDRDTTAAEVWHPAVRTAQDAIYRRYAQPLTLDDLAEAAHVTPAHLIRLFRHDLGDTPIRRLWQVRTDRGMELLAASGLTVAEIAERCGFRSAPHFARLVRRYSGLSPRAYRERAWSRDPAPPQTR